MRIRLKEGMIHLGAGVLSEHEEATAVIVRASARAGQRIR
jgi:hypothetical protein